MDISISLIVPIYNVEKYLEQCLNSILEQSIQFDEVILINDGSNDNSLLICKTYVLKYKYFKLINQKNKGLSAARNIGIENASSKYLMFLDSDDFLRTDTVKQLKDELSKFSYDIIYFDADIHCEDEYYVNINNYDRSTTYLDRIDMSGWDFFSKCYPRSYIVSSCMAIYKKDMINSMKIRFPEGVYYEDNYFSFFLMIGAKHILYISEKLYQRRYRKDSITTSIYSEKKFMDFIEITLMLWNKILRKKLLDLLEKRNILLEYINDYFYINLKNYLLCIEQKRMIKEDTKRYFICLIEKYILFFNQYPLNNNIENLPLINKISRNIRQIILYYPESKLSVENMLTLILQKQKRMYQSLLYELPLNLEGYKVGIYGTGKHTNLLYSFYENLIGKITCDLFFIDSYKKNGTYMNKNIIYYDQIDESFDLIIISSFLYEKEMINNVRSVNEEVAIYTFYNVLKEDIFSDWDLLKVIG